MDLSNLSPEQIQQALAKLTPEKLAAIRALAQTSGLTKESDNFQRLSDGSIRMILTIPADLAESLMTVVEAVNEPAHHYIEQIALNGIQGFFMGFGPDEEAPAPVP